MIVILSGSRDWDRPDVVADQLEARAVSALSQSDRRLVVRHGAAYPWPVKGVCPQKSADWFAHLWCELEAGRWDNRGLAVVEDPHPADWDHCAEGCPPNHMKRNRYGRWYCPTAGHHRNTIMAELGFDELLAFWRNRSTGTEHMIGEARRLGIEPTIVDYADVAGSAVTS